MRLENAGVKKKARAVSKRSLDGYQNYFISSIWLGRTTRFASLMGNSLSQNGHFAAIFMRSNCGDTKNSCSQPGQNTLMYEFPTTRIPMLTASART